MDAHRESGVPLLLLSLTTGLVVGGWWFLTTEVISVRVGSGVWAFYLLLALLLIALSAFAIFRSRVGLGARLLMRFLVLGLLFAVVMLGLKHRPLRGFDASLKLGLTPLFAGGDGLDVVEQLEDDAETRLLVEADDGAFVPPPMDQGVCGSCWAVASASALSARYNRMLKKEGEELKFTPVFAAAPKGFDVSKWTVSAQFLLDRDSINGTDGQCTAASSGKCSGNTQVGGFLLANTGVPSTACVPYFAGEGRCPTEAGSPESRIHSCPEDSVRTMCMHGGAVTWDKCADGSPFPSPTVEAFAVRHVVGEAAMKREIAENGPILCGINFYDKLDGSGAAWTLSQKDSLFGSYSDMIGPGFVARPEMDGKEYTTSFAGGGHAVVVYGFGETSAGVKFWQVRNSWGPSWGNGGDIKIERGRNAWAIESICAAASVREVHKP